MWDDLRDEFMYSEMSQITWKRQNPIPDEKDYSGQLKFQIKLLVRGKTKLYLKY